MEDMRRSNDLILAQDTFAFIQDGSTGNVEVAVGPFKKAIQDTDKIVIYDANKNVYKEVDRNLAITACIKAKEGQYVVLINPEKENKHPDRKGQTSTTDLEIGKKIHIPGPCAFPLYPGQQAEVLDGHQLKSNQYLMVRVYNAAAAKDNIGKSVIISTNEEEKDKKKDGIALFDKANLTAGKLHIVKGMDVSFFIPPTGIEVLKNETSDFVRDAVTLERLEYCILLDENGEKDYLKGPDVIFPNPTQVFIEKRGIKKFRAIELNENMGLYVKVIADYEDDNKKKHKAGEELFITGKDTKIYYPTPEHQLIIYEGQSHIHYATTVPAGEGRYLLNKDTGEIKLVMGPKMLLPNPINQVLVRRVLDQRMVELLFPGNRAAIEVNKNLEDLNETTSNRGRGFVTSEDFSSAMDGARSGSGGPRSAGAAAYSNEFHSKSKRTYLKADEIDDDLKRKTRYTQPREIFLDTKFSGAVMINVWPGFAVQVVSKDGERKVVQGPKVILLKYDETLEVLELSTGKPKKDHNLLKTTYLQTKHNVVSDIVEATTSDFVEVKIRLSYRVDFEEGDMKKWFNVSDYIKLMTQHMRSIIRNVTKKTSIEEFNKNAADIIRDTVLGKSATGKDRKGRKFTENGMNIYDIEILGVSIDDIAIDQMFKTSQRETIENNLNLLALAKKDELYKKKKQSKKARRVDAQENRMDKLEKQKKAAEEEHKVITSLKAITAIEEEIKTVQHDATMAREKKKNLLVESHIEKMTQVETEGVEKRMAAIDEKLIAALDSLGTVTSTEILAKNLKEYQAAGLLNGESGGFENLLKTVKGSPLEKRLKILVEKIQADS